MMATLSLTAGPCPATYACPALHAEADQRYAWVSLRLQLGPTVSHGAATAVSTAAMESKPEAPFSFTRLEIAAIQIGKRDPLPLRESARRVTRLGRLLFGPRLPNPLANARLEALRLVVIALRQPHRSPADAIDTALAAALRPATTWEGATEEP